MIETPRGFDGSDNLELHLPDGVETIVLVSELDKNLGSAPKNEVRQIRSQDEIRITENTAGSRDSWSIIEAISESVFDQIASIQFSLVVDSIIHGFDSAYEVIADSIPNPVEGMGQIDFSEKFDSLSKIAQRSVEIGPLGNAGSKTKQCYELGPFSTMEAATAIVSGMDSKVSWHRINSSWDNMRVGFWVLFRPDRAPESFEDSRANLEMLKFRGIKDTWLFTAGDLRGSISLGLFKSEARANSISKKLSAQGLNSTVQPWVTEIEQYRLQVRWNDTLTLLESWLVPYSGEDQEIQISAIEHCGRRDLDKLRFSQR